MGAAKDKHEILRQSGTIALPLRTASGWERHELLGVGGTACVYRAVRHVTNGHHQEAIWKELREELQRHPDSVECFRREAGIAAELRDPHIVPLNEADLANHRLIFGMFAGCDLRCVLDQLAGRRLSVSAAVGIALDVCSALMFAHTLTRANKPAAIVHRDLCPKNILISSAGDVLLMDFGAAALSSELPSLVRGKDPYMSPEQSLGKDTLDGRSDLFSLGAVIFEVLTRQLPTTHRGVVLETKELLEVLAERAPNVPPALATLITQLLQRDREDRPASAAALRAALLPFVVPTADSKQELGQLSRDAYDRTTKNYVALRESRQAHARLVDLNAPGNPATGNAGSTVPRDELETQPTAAPSFRSRWGVSIAGIAALAAVATVSLTTMTQSTGGQAKQETVAAPSVLSSASAIPTANAPLAASPSAVTATHSADVAPVAVNATPPASAPNVPPADPQPAPEPAHSVESAGTHRSASGAAPAMLHVFTAPPAAVKIGKRSYDVAPVHHIRLTAGTHVVTAGSLERKVTVRAGEEHDEYFDLARAGK